MSSAALSVWDALAGYPLAMAGVVVAAAAATVLPWVRDRSRFGLAALGAAITALSVAAGASVTSTIVALLVWGLAAGIAGAAWQQVRDNPPKVTA